MSVPFAVLSFNSLASFEAALYATSLCSAGPGGTRLAIPHQLLEGVTNVLVSDVVGESPFQSWGGSFILRLFAPGCHVLAAPCVEYPLVMGDGFVQREFGAEGSGNALLVDVVCLEPRSL